MSKRSSSYVGYMSPPEQTRFKKGKSGNPRGRPRKQEDLNTLLERVLNRKVRIKDHEERLPIRDALILKLRELALKGDKQALALKRRILDEAGIGAPEPHPPINARAKVFKLLEVFGVPHDHLKRPDEK